MTKLHVTVDQLSTLMTSYSAFAFRLRNDLLCRVGR